MKYHFSPARYTLAIILFFIININSIAGQGGPPADAFITVWLGNEITIPGEGTNYDIYWEDVSNPSIFGSLFGNNTTTVIFPNYGTYRVYITGNFTRINFGSPTSGNPSSLLKIEQWGNIAWTSFNNAFQLCNQMNIVATDLPNLSSVTDMSRCFYYCYNLIGNVSMGLWNTSRVTDMSSMFANAYNFNQPIGAWNTENVTNMSGMFSYAENFNQPIGIWNTANVTNMSGMFYSATSFNQPIEAWNTSNVTDMASMFSYAISFNQPIGAWNTANVTSMAYMFNTVISFNQPIGAWNTANVTSMAYMFSGARQFNQPIGAWNTSNVTSMAYMFSYGSFNHPIGTWNTSNVTDMSFMFHLALNFNQPLASWNTSKVTHMSSMFYRASSFNQPLDTWSVSEVSNLSYMFARATSFNQPIGSWNLTNCSDITFLFDNSGLDCNNYSFTLKGWASNPSTPNSLNVGTVPTQYGTDALSSRNLLISKGWSFDDSPSNTACIIQNFKYEIRQDTAICNEPTICVPIQTLKPVSDIIGYDLELGYDETKVIPTGVIRKAGVLAPNNLVETDYRIINTPSAAGKMLVSVYFNSNAGLSQRFAGPAYSDLICVEFAKKPAYQANSAVKFTIDTLKESYITGVVGEQAGSNYFITYKDTTFNSKLVFWSDKSPLSNVGATPTNIFGSNASCAKASYPTQPDVNGEFTHFLNNNELYLNIERDIAGSVGIPTNTDANVQAVINGFDAFLVRKVLLDDASFVPSIYQMIAMDVNMDGQISAGDASQINQRSIKKIGEFRQAWNYNDNGNSNGPLSKDWVFINELTLLNDIDGRYSASSIYPKWDHAGYNKDHVPVTPFCSLVPVSDWARCATIGTDDYIGILLGDVNGNYANLVTGVSAPDLRSSSRIVVDLSEAIQIGNSVEIPVSLVSSDVVNSLDLSIRSSKNLTFNKVDLTTQDATSMAYYNASDATTRFTSNSYKPYDHTRSIATIIFDMKNEKLLYSDLLSVDGYINGELVPVDIRENRRSQVSSHKDPIIYPNPATNFINVLSDQAALVELLDITNKVLLSIKVLSNQNTEIDVQGIVSGVYMMKISNNNKVYTQKVVIAR